MEDLIKAVKSLISDIENMRLYKNWFGYFPEYEVKLDHVNIEWPNLAISLEEVKKALTIDVEAAAKRLEKTIKQTTYEWTDEQFEIWWNKDPSFIKQIHTWGYFRGTQKEKCIWEAKQMLGLS